MMVNLIDKIGDWNPQLLRELKGRLKAFNVLVAVVISLVAQLGIFLYQFGDFPSGKYSMSGPYCNLSSGYLQQQNSVSQLINQVQQKINLYSGNKNYDLAKLQELKTQLRSLNLESTNLNKILYQQYCPSEQINMPLWWQDHWRYIFLSLSVMFVFTLLVAGVYLLINNLAQEERRGTLNFIRLSPQSEVSILTGKMLGVPIVIYLIVLAALPLHLWAGISAKIALSAIFSFYIVLVASCTFFYSAALLFGLISHWVSGFQPWIASGAVLIFLSITMNLASDNLNFYNAATFLRLLSPFDMMSYLFGNLFRQYNQSSLNELQFFYLPLGKNIIGLIGLHLFNYGVGIYWTWQALKRRFRNPDAAIFSKGQSYLLVACCQVMFWGFTLQYHKNYCLSNRTVNSANCYYDLNKQIEDNFVFIALFNLVLILALLIVLSPHRQDIQDWARYQYQKISSRSWWRNLILADKSPALVAMGINLAIATTPLVVWIILAPILNIHHNDSIDWVNDIGRMKAILAVALFISLMMIYATLAQLILLMKTPKRSALAIATIGALLFLPAMFLQLLGVAPNKNSIAWLFSTFPWAGIEHSAATTVFMALLAELSVFALLNFQLTKQVKLAGESATKALLTGN
ncbi:ABC transporter permease [Nostocaceae cyanobacterium CENA357]|uniref:ABC transporter permease n=1 Tax=Atlanticothrix silvestris CENA357 TaxID=1725252 RepID=A0A8J7L4S0_9CYAN|nr:ABC transporter permease subunit [Atlanticothrix silvestris]MBH8555101.1 ABC transporter permease [Atlanticothrix silvestris CENA357]